MSGFFSMKSILASGVLALVFSSSLAAQQVIKLDNDVCVRGLIALGEKTLTEIKTLSPARKIAGTCRAQQVKVKGPDLALEIGQIEWQSGTLIGLDTGKIPESLSLTLKGIKITKSPEDEPLWAFFAEQDTARRGLDARFVMRYKIDEKELVLHQAKMDFNNGNSVNLRVILTGVGADFPANPAVAAAGYLVKRAELRLTSGRTSVNPVLEAALMAVEKELEKQELGGQDFKRTLSEFVSQKLTDILGPADMVDLKRLVDDAPRAKGDILVGLASETGISLVRFALMNSDSELAKILAGVDIKFAYGARAK